MLWPGDSDKEGAFDGFLLSKGHRKLSSGLSMVFPGWGLWDQMSPFPIRWFHAPFSAQMGSKPPPFFGLDSADPVSTVVGGVSSAVQLMTLGNPLVVPLGFSLCHVAWPILSPEEERTTHHGVSWWRSKRNRCQNLVSTGPSGLTTSSTTAPRAMRRNSTSLPSRLPRFRRSRPGES